MVPSSSVSSSLVPKPGNSIALRKSGGNRHSSDLGNENGPGGKESRKQICVDGAGAAGRRRSPAAEIASEGAKEQRAESPGSEEDPEGSAQARARGRANAGLGLEPRNSRGARPRPSPPPPRDRAQRAILPLPPSLPPSSLPSPSPSPAGGWE